MSNTEKRQPMSKRKLAVIVGGILLILAGSVGGYIFYDDHIHSNIYVSKAAVAAELFDGDGAKFRNVREINKVGWVCGEVNAKNRFGAYVGFRPFATLGAHRSEAYPNPVPKVILYEDGQPSTICDGK